MYVFTGLFGLVIVYEVENFLAISTTIQLVVILNSMFQFVMCS